MWNRFMSSGYAHFLTAIVLTLGLGIVLLTGYPEKSGIAKSNTFAQSARSDEIPKPQSVVSQSSETFLPAGTFFDYTFVFPDQPDELGDD